MRLRPLRTVPLLCLFAFASCAQEVGDIDRTGDTLTRKSDLVGTDWIVRQTVSEVPATSSQLFVGYTFDTDRVRFDVTEDELIAYRAYELNPGLSGHAEIDGAGQTVDNATGEANPVGGEAFTGEALISYDIDGHYDVQRGYNTATGEQTNVVGLNQDRDWDERAFVKVLWNAPSVWSLNFIGTPLSTALALATNDSEEDELRYRQEFDEDGVLQYFEVTNRFLVEADFWDCIDFVYGWGVGDCAAQRIEIRTSFMRAEPLFDGAYEPVAYDDRAMDRFGYFRTERYTYDDRRGATLDGRLQFANRHNIWTDTWQRGADGAVARDERGKRVARPFADRAPRPVVYHLSPHFPAPLRPYAADLARGWDRALRRTVAAAQSDGSVAGADGVRPMFVLCDNPVSATPVFPEDPAYAADCGQVGAEIRIGDVRYNVLWWVNHLQKSGPLGYGPSAADPLTGEIISGTAYIYGDSVNTYAERAVDMIRFANGDLTPGDIQSADYIRAQLASERDGAIDPRAARLAGNIALARAAVPADVTELMRGAAVDVVADLRADVRDGRLDALLPGHGFEERRIRRIEESGLDTLGLNDEHLMAAGLDPAGAYDDATLERARVTRVMRSLAPQQDRAFARRLSEECVLRTDNLEDSMLGIAEAYRGRTDYEAIYQEVRGLIFKAVAEHEVGHTLGLRHNFAGSWDSLNYFDTYWDAKIEGYPSVDDDGNAVVKPFGPPETLADIYGMARLTPAQSAARIREAQYSTIMDYSSAFNTDFAGIGRYDEAAIMFAYTSGVDQNADASSPAFNEQEMGYVEVWDNLPTAARDLLLPYEDVRGIGYYHPLEEYHYSTIVSAMGSSGAAQLEALRDRRLMKLGDLEEQIASGAEGRPVEVPYMFCSDEYNGTRQVCYTWDRGADPLEQTQDYIDRYRTYYFLDSYRRERLGWDTGAPAQRIAQRIFLPLVQGYQRWLLTVAINGSRPDSNLDNGWTFAAYAGLNLVAEAATTPSSGWYDYNADDNLFQLITSRNDLSVYDAETQAQIRSQADFELPEGEGRPKWSSYDADLGYYYANWPERAGHYLTGVYALLMLTQSEAASVGVELGAFEQSYVIPPYLVFPDELTALFNGVALGDSYLAGPVVNPTSTGYEVRSRPLTTLSLTSGDVMDPETGAILTEGIELAAGALDPAAGIAVDLNASFSDQIYALIWGLSGFTSNYSARYVDQARIWELDSGSEPALAPGFVFEQFCDPSPTGAGKCYGALVAPDAPTPTLAATLVARGQRYVRNYEAALDSGTSADADSALRSIDGLLQDVNIVISLAEAFRTVF